MAVFTGNGSPAAPSFTFSSDTDLGIYRQAANRLSFTTNGTERVRLDESGNLLVGGALGSAPNISLNADGSVVVDGDIQSTSQNSGPLAGLRNLLINGDMRQWQRGAVIVSTTTTNKYTADRWYATVNSASSTVERVRNGPAGLSFCLQTSSSVTNIQQGVELIAAGEPGPFAIGTTWTLSVWSTRNLAGTTTFFNFRDEVGEPTNSVTAASPAAPAFASTGETSNGFTRYSATFSIAASPVSTNTNANIVFTTGNTAGVQFTGCQLEPGPVATPFELRPIGLELALCQRYYQIINYNRVVFNGNSSSSNTFILKAASTSMRSSTASVRSLDNTSVILANNGRSEGSAASNTSFPIVAGGVDNGSAKITIARVASTNTFNPYTVGGQAGENSFSFDCEL